MKCKPTNRSPFHDRELCELLLERGQLAGAELDEVVTLSVGLQTGQIDRLARTTRDRLMAMGRRAGILGTNRAPMCRGAWHAAQEAARPKTGGDAVMAKVLSPASLAAALANKPPMRRTGT